MTEQELKLLIESWGWQFVPVPPGGAWIVQRPDGTTQTFTELLDVEDFVRTVPITDPQGNVFYYNPDVNEYQATPSEPGGFPEKKPQTLPAAPGQYEKVQSEPAEWKTFAPQIPWKDIWTKPDKQTGQVSIRAEYQKVFDRFQETYGPLAAPTPEEKLAQTREERLTVEGKAQEKRLTEAEEARQRRRAQLDERALAQQAATERRAAFQQQMEFLKSPGDYLAYFNRLQNQTPTSFTTPTGIPRTLEAGFGGLGLSAAQGGIPTQSFGGGTQQTGLPAARGALPAPTQPATAGDLRDFVALNPGAQPPGFRPFTPREAAANMTPQDRAQYENFISRGHTAEAYGILSKYMNAPRPATAAAPFTGFSGTDKGFTAPTGFQTTNPMIAAELQRRQFEAQGAQAPGAAQGGQFNANDPVEIEVQRRLAQHRQILADNGITFPNEQLQGLLQFFRQQVQSEPRFQGGTQASAGQPTAQGGGLERTLGRASPFPLFRDLYGTRGMSGIPTRQSLQGVTGIPELSRGAFSRLPPSEQELYVGGFELAGVPRGDVFGSLNRRPEAPFFRSFR